MYHSVLIAGTFDGLHAGHEAVLTASCEAGEKVTIGLTSDAFIAAFKKNQTVRPFVDRKNTLEQWLAVHGFSEKALIISIENPYEPAASMKDLEVLVVTADNKPRGEEINRIRKEHGLSPLGLLEIPIVEAEDHHPVSSERVRNGEIDPSGRLIMPDTLRPELGKPMGNVLIGDAIGSSIEAHRNGIIVTVGDITTKTLLTAGVTPSLSIIDFLVNRKPYPELDSRLNDLKIYRIQVSSGPGFIAHEAISVMKKWATHPEEKIALVVSGEEDLLALPVIAYGPVGAVVYYGQPARNATQSVAGGPGSGLVEVVITPEKQTEAAGLLKKFI